VLTEKSLKKEQLYVFEVAREANKIDLKEIIESLYKVKVKKITTVLLKGKVKVVGKKRRLKTLANRKKAYVLLSEGEIPDIKVK
jgi:large subunit ribosomal protein L23